MLRRRRYELSILAVIVAGAGCATVPAMSDPSVRIVPGRLAAFPSYGGSFTLNFAETPAFHGDQSIDARKNVDDAINYRVTTNGGRSFLPATVAQLEHSAEFFHWSRRMLKDVMLERLASYKGPRHRSVADWRFARSLESWRTTLSADFVLVSTFYEGTDTLGRAAVAAFDGDRAARRAISCVVALEDGRVVWCKLVERFYSALGSRAGAQELVDKLLHAMLATGG